MMWSECIEREKCTWVIPIQNSNMYRKNEYSNVLPASSFNLFRFNFFRKKKPVINLNLKVHRKINVSESTHKILTFFVLFWECRRLSSIIYFCFVLNQFNCICLYESNFLIWVSSLCERRAANLHSICMRKNLKWWLAKCVYLWIVCLYAAIF